MHAELYEARLLELKRLLEGRQENCIAIVSMRVVLQAHAIRHQVGSRDRPLMHSRPEN